MRVSILALLLIAVIGGQGAAQQPRARSEQAISAIRKLGGEVRVDEGQPGRPVSVVLTGSPKAAECLPHLADVGNLQTCDL
jgi:hypothetical protein